MAGNLPVPNGVEMRLLWSLSGQVAAINVFHFNNTTSTTIDQGLATTVATSIQSAFTSSLLNAQIVPSVTLGVIGIRNMSSNTNIEYVSSGGGGVGTATNATPLPGNVSLCVSGSTGLRGASFRSRSYLWGFSVGAVAAAGGVSTPASTAAALFCNTIRTNLAALPNPLVMSVLSRFTTPPGSPPGTPSTERNPPIMTTITTWAVKNAIWDTQRRRSIPGV